MPSLTSQPHRILVVEHNRPIRDLLHIFLQQEGYETERASDLEEAFAKVEEQPFDLVVMDPFVLPNQPRLASAQRLKQQCSPTPVGIITGWPIAPEEAEQAGFAFLVSKPFSFESLMKQIAARLNQPFSPEQQQQALVIQRFLEALGTGDWETVRALCLPTICYYLLTRSAFTSQRAFIGIEAYLAYARLVRHQLPDLRIEQVVIFQQAKGLLARYRFSWQGRDGQRHALAGSAQCRFRGERLSQIGVAQPTQRLRTLLDASQGPTSA